jgi:arsenite methyltransferase
MSSYLDYKFEDSSEFVNYFDELPLWSAPFGLLLLKHLKVRKNSTIVDVGSGTGFPLLELASRFGSSCTVYGIDCWANANERARQKTAYHKLGNVVIKNESAEKMSFENGRIDMVVSNLGLNNFESVENVFREVYRILKPGGSFIITTNSFGHWKEMYEVLYQCLAELELQEAIELLQKEETHRLTGDKITQVFTNNGFIINKQVTELFSIIIL